MSTAASAGGFQVNLAGQRNIGMGGVGVGLSLDQAAMFYNPGALAMVRKNGVQVGVNATFARVSFVPQGGTTQSNAQHDTVTPFNLYASFGPTDGKLRFGIAVYTPFGSKLRYQDNWTGRYALTQIDLKSIFIQPTVSYALTDQISIGAGLVILGYGSVNLQRDIPVQDGSGNTTHLELDGKAKNKLGYNAGIYFKPSDKLSVGISYRSQVDATVSGGSVAFRNLPSSVASSFSATKFDVTLPLPATTSVGIGVTPSEKLTIGLDANLVSWSRYKSLDFAFNGTVGGSTTSTSKRYYQDALTFRLGGQYLLTEGLAVRAGVSYDFTPVKDGYITPETPDADRVGLAAGATYNVNDQFGIDVSFLYEMLQKRSQTQSDLLSNGTTDRVAGTYKTTAAVPGIGVHYNF